MKLIFQVGIYQLSVVFRIGVLFCLAATGIVEFYELNYSYNKYGGLIVCLECLCLKQIIQDKSFQNLAIFKIYNVRARRTIKHSRIEYCAALLSICASLLNLTLKNMAMNELGTRHIIAALDDLKRNEQLLLNFGWLSVLYRVDPVLRVICTFASTITYCFLVEGLYDALWPIPAKTKTLPEDTKATEDQQKCSVCMSNRVRICLPCGHFILCHGCYSATKTSRKCLLCNEPYEKGIKVFV
jgi:hypothetical protein